MGISVIGQIDSQDKTFSINVGATGNNVVVLGKEYSAGDYSITSQLNDTTFDVYCINADESLVGYTNTTALSCSRGFSKVVILGATNNDILTFEYKTTFSPTEAGTVGAAGAYITSITPTDLPNINNTITINGGNFSTNVAVTFTGTNNAVLNAKSIVRVSSNQLLVTRPDNLIQDHSPYDLTVTNPGITPPASVQYIISNGVTAGGDPTWVTASGALPSAVNNGSYSTTVSATDPDGSAITYSLVSGSLPTGLQLDGATGVIAGTPTVLNTFNFTLAATDPSGNVTNRSFSITVANPVAATGGTITTVGNFRYHTFTGNGTLSVTNGGTIDALVIAGGAGGSGFGGGGGGAGGYRTLSAQSISTGNYAVTVGGGGAGGTTSPFLASAGSNSSLGALLSSLGGARGSNDTENATPPTGGSGGGGGTHASGNSPGGAGTAGQGNNGGASTTLSASGGGGGAGQAGANTSGNNSGKGGDGLTWVDGVTRAGGGGGGSRASGGGSGGAGGAGGGGRGSDNSSNNRAAGTANTGGGGGGGRGFDAQDPGASGGSGVVIIRYSLT